jgi:hypothetical protein
MLTASRSDSPLSVTEKVVMGALVWVVMLSWGGLLESRPWADWLEAPKLLLFAAAAVAVYADGDWAAPLGLATAVGTIAFALAFSRIGRAKAEPRTA